MQREPNDEQLLIEGGDEQSQKNPVSASAMLTGKFLRIRKVLALWAEEFLDNLEKCPDAIQNIQIKCKVSGCSGKYPDNLENVSG